ncbi:MAG TPA: hypothetical protein GX706_04465 [Candidatus Moranbacteria bacterium]|nr:hypothetical protein [Candidatus Moranbacteria bacterium]
MGAGDHRVRIEFERDIGTVDAAGQPIPDWQPFDPPLKRWGKPVQNRAYLTQTWELWLDVWLPIITIPRPPLLSVESVCWYDAEHQEHTLDPAEYFADVNSEPGRIFPAAPWPASIRSASGICITFKAGREDERKIPGRVRQAILLLVAEWYLNREASSLTGRSGAERLSREIPFGVTRLLDYDRMVPV